MGLVLIGWVGPKINGLDLRNGLGPNGWVYVVVPKHVRSNLIDCVSMLYIYIYIYI